MAGHGKYSSPDRPCHRSPLHLSQTPSFWLRRRRSGGGRRTFRSVLAFMMYFRRRKRGSGVFHHEEEEHAGNIKTGFRKEERSRGFENIPGFLQQPTSKMCGCRCPVICGYNCGADTATASDIVSDTASDFASAFPVAIDFANVLPRPECVQGASMQ